MAIKRYYAKKDNTITNAFKSNLSSRGELGNMGQSDILEVFNIYAQATTSSSELSRILIEFDTDAINADRAAKKIPASGSVSFFLRMYDARHSQTTPKDFTIVATAVSQSWNEGLGLDMEEYSDEDASNYLSASSGVPWADITGRATATIQTVVKELLTAGTFTLTDAAGTSTTYGFVTGVNVSANTTAYTPGTTINIGIDGMAGGSAGAVADQIIARINAGTDIGFTASKIGNNVLVTQNTAGTVGNKTNTQDSGMGDFVVNNFIDGANIEGGSYKTGSDASPLEYHFTQFFDTGFEDLEIDVSHLVEDWIKGPAGGGYTNYGFGVHLTSSNETAENSYYIKKFFARGSQYFHKRPVIEARWNNSKKDNRGDFFLSSSLVSGPDNLMNLYLYNIVRGQLKDIPGLGENNGVQVLNVNIHSGSTGPIGEKLTLPIGGGVVANNDINITASHVETGIYSCSFAYTSSAITKIYDVWSSGTIQYHTGSAVAVKTFNSQNYNLDQKYVSKITNLKTEYSTQETARFRLFVRSKNFQPNIYTVANQDIENTTVDNIYYQVKRSDDGLTVIEYGTGSLNHTKLSCDASGSYFDLDIGMLEADNSYKIKFVYLINGSYVEQSETFRFNVV